MMPDTYTATDLKGCRAGCSGACDSCRVLLDPGHGIGMVVTTWETPTGETRVLGHCPRCAPLKGETRTL